MTKKILAIVCLAMVTITFSGCSLLEGDKDQEATKEKTNVEQNQKTVKDETSVENGDKSGNYFETMTDLLARGKTMKCTYHQEVEGGGTADGIVYMADGNSLVEIITNDTADLGKIYALITNEWHYSWVDGAPGGFKMTVEAAEMDEKMKNSVSKMTDEIDFECKKWKKDNSKFKVPSNVNFQDMSGIMEGFDTGKAMDEIENIDTNKIICDLCKNAPASEQAECLGDVVCDWQ